MREFSRRSMLRASAGLGIAGLLSQSVSAEEEHSSGKKRSPHLEKYVQPLPIPGTREPDDTRHGRDDREDHDRSHDRSHRGADYHEIQLEEAQHQFHPDLGETTIWGFDGQFPGPIIEGRSHEPLYVEFDNSQLPSSHLFEVDERIPGTTSENYVGYDGPVPEVRNVTHFHGLNNRPESDGQAEMWTSPGGVTGPRFSKAVQKIPNRQARLTAMYHDHARGISRLNNYAGLFGPYYIRSEEEERLDIPEGDYEVPLVLADRMFDDDGSLFYPDEFMATFGGDVATVNGAAWPYMEVEPRKYRFRIINISNSRVYDLGLTNANDESGDVPVQYQISPSHGFLEEVVSIGQGEDLESLVVAPFERAEIIIDFSEFAGETFTVTNDAEFPYEGGKHSDGGMDMGGMDGGMDMGHGGIKPQFHEVMQFRVKETVSQPDRTTHPTELRLPEREKTEANAAVTTRTIPMGMEMDEHGLMKHTLNGREWGDGIQEKPQLGTTEIWELVNNTGHTHPIHLHLVDFDVIEREPHDADHGPQPPLPNELGGKDVVRVNPSETVRIAVQFVDFAGKFPFHCHIMEHEEHDMMRMFEVVSGHDDHSHGHDDYGGTDGGRN